MLPSRPHAERVRLPPLVEVAVLDAHGQRRLGHLLEARTRRGARSAVSRARRQARIRRRGRRRARGRIPSRRLTGARPPAKSQTHAATTPSGRVTRAISRSPATGSDMKCTTSCARAASNESSSNGRCSAGARSTITPGSRVRAATTNVSDGSTAVTRSGPTLATSSEVSAPGPHPTSTTVRPATTPARSAKRGARGTA